MITDITYDSRFFILEKPLGTPGGVILAYSLEGSAFDFSIPVAGGGETSHVFIS